jgi:phytoene dehydrogenase-like protein
VAASAGGRGSTCGCSRIVFAIFGGRLEVNAPVTRLSELPPARAVLCDVTPRQLIRIAGHVLPAGYRRSLEAYRYGLGACKVDWALSGPIPWRNPECARAATVHVGGTMDEIAAAEAAPWRGQCHPRPFVLLVQPTLFDPTRAPEGKHVAWAYCHVPHGEEPI